MKLPDFYNYVEFNKLRKKMNAKLIDFTPPDWEELNKETLIEKLNSHEGVIIDDINSVEFEKDGTIVYKGQKVLLYIRDQIYDPLQPRKEYKFHISKCDTIQRYIHNKRIDRYVVSTRTDGKFLVNIIDRQSNEYIEKNVIKELKVCKNCLMTLHYKGYSDHKRDVYIYKNFDLKEFFEMYKTNQNFYTTLPKYNDTIAPPDLYTPEGKLIADRLKSYKNWRCEKCGIDLSQNKKFLHVHHINGVKSDNRIENLKVLCIQCHAEEPDHKHLKKSFPEYKEFIKKFGSEGKLSI